jgi:hypothetical protein
MCVGGVSDEQRNVGIEMISQRQMEMTRLKLDTNIISLYL